MAPSFTARPPIGPGPHRYLADPCPGDGHRYSPRMTSGSPAHGRLLAGTHACDAPSTSIQELAAMAETDA